MTRAQERGLVLLVGFGLLVGGAVLLRPSDRRQAVGPAVPILVSSVAVVAPVVVQPAPVDVNVADVAELTRLPGIGPALAARIVAYREEHGPYRSIDDLARVRGIGPATVERLRGDATVDGAAAPVRSEL